MVGCLRIAEGYIIAPPDLLQFVVVSQREQCALNEAHLLHFTHDVLIDAIHDLLVRSKDKQGLEMVFTPGEQDERRTAQEEKVRGALTEGGRG